MERVKYLKAFGICIFLLLVWVSFSQNFLYAQTAIPAPVAPIEPFSVQWVQTYGDSGDSAVAVQPFNNVFLYSGSYNGTFLTLPPAGPSERKGYIRIADSLTGNDIPFNLNFTSDRTYIDNMALDSQNNIIYTGRFSRSTPGNYTVNFNILPGGTPDLQGNITQSAAFVTKILSNVQYGATRLIKGTIGGAVVYDTAVDPRTNDVYVTGSFNGSVDFNPPPHGTGGIRNTLDEDVFITKYSPGATGNSLIYQWTFSFSNSTNPNGNTDRFKDISVDSRTGNIVVAGEVEGRGQPIILPGIGPVPTIGAHDGIILVLSPMGNILSYNIFGNLNSGIEIADVKFDYNGDILLSGIFNGTVNFAPPSMTPLILVTAYPNNPGHQDTFLVKYSGTNLNPLWGNTYQPARLYGQPSFPNIEFNRCNEIYIMGWLMGSLTNIGMASGGLSDADMYILTVDGGGNNLRSGIFGAPNRYEFFFDGKTGNDGTIMTFSYGTANPAANALKVVDNFCP